MTMPRAPNSNGRVSKTTAPTRSLNEPNIAAHHDKKKRLDASDQEILELWYERLGAVIASVSTENIYNFDDTIFQIGQGKKPRMVVTRGGFVPIQTRTYCEWITTIECIAADGWAADPFVVIQGDHYFDEWLTYEGTPDEAVFMMNSSGQVDELAACEWLESFHRQTEDRAADGQPKLVLFRSQPQYLSFKFLNFCEQHKILPFSFPPNIGHLIQPFDGKPFQCYKQYWRSQGILFCMIDDPDDEKTVFLMDFPSIRETSFKPEVITKAFADRGIVPFDPYKVKQPL